MFYYIIIYYLLTLKTNRVKRVGFKLDEKNWIILQPIYKERILQKHTVISKTKSPVREK